MMDDPRPRILPVLVYSILFPVKVPLNERYRITSGERRRIISLRFISSEIELGSELKDARIAIDDVADFEENVDRES